jgi:uncharacterized protein (TIGR03382 family)
MAVASSILPIRALLVTGILGMVSNVAIGGPCLDVALDGADAATFPDVTSRLLATEKVASVRPLGIPFSINGDYDTDVILVVYDSSITAQGNSSQWQQANGYGNLYADYVDAGGGIVAMQPGLAEDVGPTGRYKADYLPFHNASFCGYGTTTTGGAIPPENSLFDQVFSLSNHENNGAACADWTVHPDATVHAWWPSEQPLIATLGRVVSINSLARSFDAPNQVFAEGYPPDSDMAMLIANALVYAAGHDPRTACNGDEDDDGLLDTDEDLIGTDWENPDTDEDGEVDGADLCPLIADAGPEDTDSDGIGDACDEDLDGDDVPNTIDLCPVDFDPAQSDLDSDGIGDVCDEDLDGDGISDVVDNCHLVPNPEQTDSDNDGLGDACDPIDTDNDGIPDTDDNCPDDANSNQEDSDNNGTGDACEEPTIGCTSLPGGPTGGLGVLVGLLALRRRRRANRPSRYIRSVRAV